jgi:hypothetical protein
MNNQTILIIILIAFLIFLSPFDILFKNKEMSSGKSKDTINQYLTDNCKEKFSNEDLDQLIPDFESNSFNITNKINDYGYDTNPWDNNFYKNRVI